MPRIAQDRDLLGDEAARQAYLRMMAGWIGDLMRLPASATWGQPDPQADFRDHNWQRLYTGSILDD